MLSNVEIAEKWHGHIRVPKLKVADIHIPHQVDLKLLPNNWDFREKNANSDSILVKKDVANISVHFKKQNNDGSSEKPLPLYKLFDTSLLHELYIQIPIVPHKLPVTNTLVPKKMSHQTLFGDLPSDVIVSNKLHTELLQNDQQIYISPFLIEHGNSMYDHIYQYKNQSSVDVIDLSSFKSLLVEFFLSVLSGTRFPITKFRLSGTSIQSTNKLMQFVQSIADLLLPLIENQINPKDLFLCIVFSETKLYIDSFIIILCNPVLSSFPNSKLPENPYFSIFANSLDLYHSTSISSIMSWLYQFHYLCYLLSLLITQLSKASSIEAISTISINHPLLSVLLDNIKSRFFCELKLYIYNQLPLICHLLESDLDLINHHLKLPVYASTIIELQRIMNNKRLDKYNAHLQSDLLHKLAKQELFEIMMIKQPFKDIDLIALVEAPQTSPIIQEQPDILEQLTKEEKEMLEWRIKRLKRFKQIGVVEEVEIIQEQVDAMQIDEEEPKVPLNPIIHDDLATFQSNSIIGCQMVNITTNDSINIFDIIMIRDISCMINDLINNDTFSAILQLFQIVPFLIKQGIHSDSIIIPNGLIHIKDGECFCKLDIAVIWFPFEKLIQLLNKYYTSLFNLYKSLETASVANRIRLKALESEFFLGITIGLQPLLKLLDLVELWNYHKEYTWELDVTELASDLVMRVAAVSINKMHKMMDMRDLSGFANIPKERFGTTKWFTAWGLWVDINDVDNVY